MRALIFMAKKQKGSPTFTNQKDFSKHLAYLHTQGDKPYPMVLVEGAPGEKSPKWMHYEEYKKLLKKEEMQNAS